jgi:hypothetical protein
MKVALSLLQYCFVEVRERLGEIHSADDASSPSPDKSETHVLVGSSIDGMLIIIAHISASKALLMYFAKTSCISRPQALSSRYSHLCMPPQMSRHHFIPHVNSDNHRQ